jgi:hypothetical protein
MSLPAIRIFVDLGQQASPAFPVKYKTKISWLGPSAADRQRFAKAVPSEHVGLDFFRLLMRTTTGLDGTLRRLDGSRDAVPDDVLSAGEDVPLVYTLRNPRPTFSPQ